MRLSSPRFWRFRVAQKRPKRNSNRRGRCLADLPGARARHPHRRHRSLPGPPCISAQPHSFPSWQGVLPISRSRCNASAEGLLEPISRTCTYFGARAGNRTLNLGIKRLQTDRLRASQRTSARLCRIREMTQSSLGVSRCLTESPGEAVNEAVKSEGAEALCNANRATVCGQQISLDHEPASP